MINTLQLSPNKHHYSMDYRWAELEATPAITPERMGDRYDCRRLSGYKLELYLRRILSINLFISGLSTSSGFLGREPLLKPKPPQKS